jgi:nucleotide-binding universal stress UspA family protein
MYRTIIVPLDGSAVSERAADTAAGLAERGGLPLELIRVHRMYPHELPDHAAWDTAMRHEEERYLARVAQRLEREAGITVHTAVLEGLVVASICGHAQSLPEPLVVMTSHGRTGVSRAWLGSVADGVLHHAAAPILMLRASDDDPTLGAAISFKRIIVPLDGSEIAEQAIPHALIVAEMTGAQLLLLRVVVPLHAPPPLPFAVPTIPAPDFGTPTVPELREHAESYLERLTRKLRGDYQSLDVRSEVCVDDAVTHAILDVARRHQCDLAVMVTHGRGLSRLVIGSVADKVLRGGPPAVLLTRVHHD